MGAAPVGQVPFNDGQATAARHVKILSTQKATDIGLTHPCHNNENTTTIDGCITHTFRQGKQSKHHRAATNTSDKGT